MLEDIKAAHNTFNNHLHRNYDTNGESVPT